MKFLLLHGTANSGKTDGINQFCNYLKQNNWKVSEFEKLGKDIRATLNIKINGVDKCVILCSGSDTEEILKGNKRFIEKSSHSPNILVLAKRLDDPLNKIFENYFHFTKNDQVLIVPLAHINGRHNDCSNMRQRYKNDIDLLTQKLFSELI